VYAVDGLNPVTVIGLLAPVAVMEPGLDNAWYPVMLKPPVLVGAVKATVAVVAPVAVAVPIVGAPGSPEYVPPVKALSIPLMSH
jgi:hypothetical protein